MSSNEKMVMVPCSCGQVPRISNHEGSAIHVSCKCGVQLWGAKSHFGSEQDCAAEWNRRHHGEPVALPERMEPHSHLAQQRDWKWSEGWNAYHDAIAKLGPLFSRPVQGEPVAWLWEHKNGLRICTITELAPFTKKHATPPNCKKTPLYTHADPGEVERLRTALGNTQALLDQANYHKAQRGEIIDTLRAQLAERDALLKRQPSFIRALEQFEADDGTFVRFDDVLDALSASAEPHAPVERDERAAYDAWRNSALGYVRHFDRHEWAAWQARAALERQP